MDALKAVGFCALLVSPQNAASPCPSPAVISSPNIDRWQLLIADAARRFEIPEAWIAAVMARESAGLTTLDGKPITSRAGAMGLMQLMPETYAELRARYGFGPDPYNDRDNVLAGAAYLRAMFDRYAYPGLFAAYHAGPGRMEAYLRGEKPLPEATQTYLESLVPGIEITPIRAPNPAARSAKSSLDPLFFVRRDDNNPSPDAAHGTRDLFVPLGASAP
jgi:soluble lytic murein transglycosylase-like protein